MIQISTSVRLTCDTGCGAEMLKHGGVNSYSHTLARDVKIAAEKASWRFVDGGKWVCPECAAASGDSSCVRVIR